MTAREDLSLPVRIPLPESPWQRLVISFLATLLALALLAAASATAYVRLYDGRILPGVAVAGVDVGGLDPETAEERLREELPSLSDGSLTLQLGHAEAEIPYADLARDYDLAPMLEQALGLGRDDGSTLEQALGQLRVMRHGASIAPLVGLDTHELSRRVMKLEAAAEAEPVDAALVRVRDGYEVVPAQEGLSVDGRLGLRLAVAALGEVTPEDARVSLPAVEVHPSIFTQEAEQALEAFESVVGSPLTVEAGEASATVEPGVLRGWVRLDELPDGGWAVAVDKAAMRQFVEQFAREADASPQEATLGFEKGRVVARPAVVGLTVDVPATSEALHAALHARAGEGIGGSGLSATIGSGTPDSPLQAAAMTILPELGTEQAEELAESMERLSRWRTRYVRGELNYYGANIDIPTEKIHETVLQPGERFDFWEIVGFPTVEQGYGPGGAIINGEMTFSDTLAGGICAVSTTIFNAALRAGLETGARRNHHFHLNRYPLGLDATVWINRNGRGTTVRFTNDMDRPVIIRGIGRHSAVISEVWGVPDDREVSISRPRVEDRGSTYDVWRTRTVTDADGQVIHEDTYHSRYAWPQD